jgi:hypothetical protein
MFAQVNDIRSIVASGSCHWCARCPVRACAARSRARGEAILLLRERDRRRQLHLCAHILPSLQLRYRRFCERCGVDPPAHTHARSPEPSMMAKHFERLPLALRAQAHTLVACVKDEVQLRQLLQHRRNRRSSESKIRGKQRGRYISMLPTHEINRLQIVQYLGQLGWNGVSGCGMNTPNPNYLRDNPFQ